VKKTFSVFFCLFSFTFIFSTTSCAVAQDGSDISIMVLSDDSDPLSLPSNTSVSKLIRSKISEQFHRYHFTVIPQEQLSADEDLGFNLNKRMDTSKLLKVAMAAKSSGKQEFDIRAVVIYKVFPQLKELDFGKQLTLEISGEVHDADSKRLLGDFGPLLRKFPAPSDCNDDACISSIARQKAVDIAMIVADEGRKKLAMLTKSSDTGAAINSLNNTFNIRLENFAMKDALNIKSRMENDFPNFQKSGKINGSEPVIEFGYITKSPQQKIFEWLNILMEDLKIDKLTKIESSGNSFVIKQIGSDLKIKPKNSDSESKFK